MLKDFVGELKKKRQIKDNFKVWGLNKKKRMELPLTDMGRINFLIGFLLLASKRSLIEYKIYARKSDKTNDSSKMWN